MPALRVLLAAVAVATVAFGCQGPGKVRFDHETCFIDGQPANMTRVEEREALVGRRVAVRQPWLVAITVIVVSLAGISYIERLVLLFSTRRDSQTMGERLRALIDRYRAHPARYFSLVGGTFGLLVLAGTLYIYLDADKRASERALSTLQFCHLALRTNEEKKALDDQRFNLASIHETAGEIRQLISKLPPAEQAKAHEIIGHMDDAVKQEGRLLEDHLQRSEDMTLSIRDGTQSIVRDLADLEGRIPGLKELPAALRGVDEGIRKLEAQAGTAERASAETVNRLTALARTVDDMAHRPAPSCPACVCSEPKLVSSSDARPDGSTP